MASLAQAAATSKQTFTILSTEPFSPFIGNQSLGLEQGFKGKYGVLIEMGNQSNFDASYLDIDQHQLKFWRLSCKYYLNGFRKSGADRFKDNSFLQVGLINMNQNFETSYFDIIMNKQTHFLDSATVTQHFKIKGMAGFVNIGKRYEWHRICLEMAAGFNLGKKNVDITSNGTFTPHRYPTVPASYQVFCPFLMGKFVMGIQANVKIGLRLF
jgi:hypothetical protein